MSDEENVEQIRENAYMQYLLGFAGHSSKAPFDPSMMVHFRKRFTEKELRRVNERLADRETAVGMAVVKSHSDDDEPDDPEPDGGHQLSLDDFVKPVD